MTRLFNFSICAAAMAVLITGCQKSSNNESGALNVQDSNNKGFFSDRPSKPSTDPKKNFFFGLVKLKTPSIFATGKIENGKVVVDADQVKAIEEEQKQFLSSFAMLSPEVKAIYTYKYLVNAVAIYVPGEVVARIRAMNGVVDVVEAASFRRPQIESLPSTSALTINERNSVKFIGAEAARAMKVKRPDGQEVAIDGAGMTVGIIDTGVDFTHKMFGGEGTEAAYKAVDPNKAHPSFPNAKVIAGYDFVGTEYNSVIAEHRLPIPDVNPIDEADHGTHVAGTVAGLGDGIETYSGVAPGASLYALKVFGKDGSTDDPVVIAALEYSVDPNKDGQLNDQVDVINMSLGSPYGSPSALYNEAIRNMVRGGTVVVASAGNSGDFKYITGEPATSDEAISVAASVDDMDHNWKFATVRVKFPEGEDTVVEAIESSLTKSMAEIGEVTGKFVFLGIADTELTEEQKSQLKGNVALIDRGKVTFAEKIKRAFEGGAIGVVVANSVPGEPMVMGGDGTTVGIPGIMISLDLGIKIKEMMKKGEVVIRFKNPDKLERPELIDSITGFSSRGPRMTDALIKPEISSPGASIISAKTGSGDKGMKMSGTSMAGPHVAGVMALLKQAKPGLTPNELKSLLLGRAKTMQDPKKVVYPISRQGSGRVQVIESITAKAISNPSTLSLGFVAVQTVKAMRSAVELKNLTNVDQVLSAEFESRSPHIAMNQLAGIQLKAGATVKLNLRFLMTTAEMTESIRELDGWVKFKSGTEEVLRIPVLAIAQKVTTVKATEFIVHSSGAADAPSASAELKLENSGAHDADVLVFNLFDIDARKKNEKLDPYLSRSCDLQAAGYRIIPKTINGRKTTVLQVAAKLYEPLTSWHACDFSVLFDSNGDRLPDQELAIIRRGALPGLATPGKDEEVVGILVDSNKARTIRENADAAEPVKGKKVEPDYSGAVVGMAPITTYDHSTIAMIEAEVPLLTRRATGELAIRIATTHRESSPIEADDFLGTLNDWMKVSVLESSQSFMDMPEVLKVKAHSTEMMDLTKGYGTGDLLILMPQNPFVISDQLMDSQAVIAQPSYSFAPKTP